MDVYDLWALTACTWIPGRSLKLIASSMSLVSLSMMMTSCSMAERCDSMERNIMVRFLFYHNFNLRNQHAVEIICVARASDTINDSFCFIRYSSPMIFGVI